MTENAGIVSLEAPILRESVSFFESENLRETRWTSQLIFALDTKRELELSLPLVSRESTFHPAGSGEETADLFGLGDASIRFKQSLWQRDDVMESTRWAFLTELGVPTGDDDADENGASIPTRHEEIQLGSSTDFNLAYWYRLSPAAFRAEEETTTAWVDPTRTGMRRRTNRRRAGWQAIVSAVVGFALVRHSPERD